VAQYAVIITFGDYTLRDATRPDHRVYLRALFDAGKLVESGPFVDDTGALLIYEADSEDEVRALLANDPYAKSGGVIAETTIKEWNRIFPPS
jgi:uncharacterized protein YciI